MRLYEVGEFALIEALTRGLPQRKEVVLGVGDDAAVLKMDGSKYLIATCDMMVEEVHFSLRYSSFFQIGWKAMASSLSDIAAMGARGLFALCSIGLKPAMSDDEVQQIYQGLLSLAKRHEVSIVGGDTVSSPKGLVVDLTLLGETSDRRFIPRSGAQDGDALFLSGFTGRAQAGLDLLMSGDPYDFNEKFLMDAHLLPIPRCEEGLFLASRPELSSMIDISDGLCGDLGHLCLKSGLGAKLWEDNLPVAPTLREFCHLRGLSPLDYILFGGEDYELLFTASMKAAEDLLREWKQRFSLSLSLIGQMDSRVKGIELVSGDGQARPLPLKGYQHFMKER